MPILQTGVSRVNPGFSADAAAVNARATRRKEMLMAQLGPSRFGSLEEGSYVTCTHQTPGTTIVAAKTVAFSATAAYMIVRNTSATALSAGGKCFIPDFIKLCVGVVPATTPTSARHEIATDRSNRYSSGGTQFSFLPTNPGSTAPTTSELDLYAGAVVLAAAGGNTRYHSPGFQRGVIPVVLDQYVFEFDGNDAGPMDIAGTTAKIIAMKCPPVILEPNNNDCLILHVWNPPSNAGAAAEYEFCVAGWWV